MNIAKIGLAEADELTRRIHAAIEAATPEMADFLRRRIAEDAGALHIERTPEGDRYRALVDNILVLEISTDELRLRAQVH